MRKIYINTSITATFIINIIFVALYTIINKNFIMALVSAAAITVISVLLAVCKYKFGLYDDIKGYEGNCHIVYITQISVTAIAVLAVSILTR